MSDAIYVHRWDESTSSPGPFLAVNDVACRMLKYSREELLDISPDEIDEPEGATDTLDVMKRLKQGGHTVFERTHIAKDGQRIPVEINAHLSDFMDGRVILSCARDITKRKRMEAALRATEEQNIQLVMAVQQASESFLLINTKGVVEYVNPAFEEITGYSRKEMIGYDIDLLARCALDEASREKVEQSIAAGKGWEGQVCVDRRDGSICSFEGTVTPLRGRKGEIVNYVIVAREVTQQMTLLNQVIRSQRMEAVGQLAGGVAHDFNNLLQTIVGYVRLALMDAESGTVSPDDLRQIQNAAEKATVLTRQLLAFGRRQTLKPVALTLNEVVADLMKMLRRVIGEHIELDFHPGEHLATVLADPGQMEQVLMNLCMNARDAMPTGGKITIATSDFAVDERYRSMNPWAQADGYVLLAVSDTGTGMNHEVLEHVFEPFYTTKEEGKGTGLGLAMVHGIVKQHNGNVNVYSELGKGTVFRIYLPMNEAPAECRRSKPQAEALRGSETILLAEDDEAVRVLAIRILNEAGYEVIPVCNGEEAIDAFKADASRIDMALMDVVMPKMGGKAAYDLLKDIRPEIRVLFSSGYSSLSLDKEIAPDEGLQFVQKPYDPRELLSKVRETLDGATRVGA